MQTNSMKSDLAVARVVVVTTAACPYCKAAKEALIQDKIAFGTVDVSASQDLRAQLTQITGSKTVPQASIPVCIRLHALHSTLRGTQP